MKESVHQGDILKIEKITNLVLVTSKDFFNQTGEIIGCPIFKESNIGPLHIEIKTDEVYGIVQCEKLRLLDLSVRGFSRIDRVAIADSINITDAIQGIFDYI